MTHRGHHAVECWLVAFAVAYGVLHHQGFLFAGFGNVGFVADGGTRWADWLDLATPFLVLGPAIGAMVAARAVRPTQPHRRSVWLLATTGVVLYVEGHGIHLAANSISNETEAAGSTPTPVTHLWDEPVGHHLWFGGLTLVVIALVVVLRRCGLDHRDRSLWLPGLLSLQFGFTYATNALEGGTAILGLMASIGLTGWAARSPRDAVSLAVLATFVPSLLLIGGYGLIQGGFPQPSEVGWGVFG